MNREIKFRAWDYKTETMWQVEELSWCDPCFILANPGLEHMDIQDRDFRTKRVPDDIVLMQFTGLHDKNGKEIYDSDILEDDDSPRLETVTWDFAGWWVKDIKTGYLKDRLSRTELQHETVLGNIYENPELLEK